MWKLWKNRNVNGNEETLLNRKSLEEKVQRWLREEGFEVVKTQSGNLNFRYLVTKNKLPRFSVWQPKGKSNSILIESGIGFRGIEKTKLASIFDRNQSLFWELRLHLASEGFFYKIKPPDLYYNSPGGIIIAKLVYYDGLSKATFLESVFKVLHTTIFIILTLQQHLTVSDVELTSKGNSLPYVK